MLIINGNLEVISYVKFRCAELEDQDQILVWLECFTKKEVLKLIWISWEFMFRRFFFSWLTQASLRVSVGMEPQSPVHDWDCHCANLKAPVGLHLV